MQTFMSSDYGTSRTARTARKTRRCDTGRERIQPGDRYLRLVMFPGHDGNSSGKPQVYATCVSCATDRGDELHTGACLSYCCGIRPCPLPNRHGGDHRCPNCNNLTAPA